MGFIKAVAKFIAYFVLVIVVLVGGVMFAARFADGPWEMIAGGPFTSGTLQSTEPDWVFVKDIGEVEFQLEEPAASRTTWVMEHNNRVFIPCGYMNSTLGRIWKQWPIQVRDNPKAILRVQGKLWERKLVRIKDDPDLDVVLSELGRKYMNGASVPRSMVDSNSLWIFELVPR